MGIDQGREVTGAKKEMTTHADSRLEQVKNCTAKGLPGGPVVDSALNAGSTG